MHTSYPVNTSGSSHQPSGQVTPVARDDVGGRPFSEPRFQASPPRTSGTGPRVVDKVHQSHDKVVRITYSTCCWTRYASKRRIDHLFCLRILASCLPHACCDTVESYKYSPPLPFNVPETVIKSWDHCYRNTPTDFARTRDCLVRPHLQKAGGAEFELEQSRLFGGKIQPHCI